MAKVDLSITFLGDDNVVDHIVNIAVGNDKQNKTTSSRTSKPIIIEPSDDHDGATGAYQRCSKTEATEDTKKFPSQKRGALKPISNQVHENSVEENGSDVSVDEDTNNIDDNGSDLEAESSTTTSSKKLDMEDTIDNCAEYAKNQRARCLLYKIYRKKFNWWMSELWEGFNLLFYGLGSKRTLLEQFRAVLLQSYPHLVVNGYFPNMSIKNILNSITQDILKFEASFRSPIDQCNYITNSLNGIPFQECYIKCRENFLVNSESTLKAHLTEFFDHKMIKSRKGPLGVEHLSIPIDTTLLSDFMDDYNV
ncbi:uncharacterized protein TRIADDRAFT_61999 [Trichoplax adhaerens]|uniref:Origin recognition complex subunit 2 n=1 Tax=Trichoplax adhaerens TaxID=10228 RepID=B3SCJ9_TRIAD|nr:hypothetical protein TRIADDRAFT_61999 [Trichoplax adhaerens]EDV19549.1 hypothetical protein TRIADDRAFT_61999 [Trichoplax adhaerens]|eukprot:XP_002117981.1 hypothetical protein TRIADDRAFT_61999 [Trichoplax adhaerens]